MAARHFSREPLMKISEHIRTTTTQDGAVLMNIKGGQMITLNPTGSIIWQQLRNGRSREQIAERLTSDFGIGRDQALADVNEFVGQLEAQHLIEPEESGDLRSSAGPRPFGLFCNSFGKRGARAAANRGAK
jgi:hypothetical protein